MDPLKKGSTVGQDQTFFALEKDGINSLPNELLWHIFYQLSYPCAPISLVCRRWKQVNTEILVLKAYSQMVDVFGGPTHFLQIPELVLTEIHQPLLAFSGAILESEVPFPIMRGHFQKQFFITIKYKYQGQEAGHFDSDEENLTHPYGFVDEDGDLDLPPLEPDLEDKIDRNMVVVFKNTCLLLDNTWWSGSTSNGFKQSVFNCLFEKSNEKEWEQLANLIKGIPFTSGGYTYSLADEKEWEYLADVIKDIPVTNKGYIYRLAHEESHMDAY